MNPQELAKYIDHTLLAPMATADDIKELCNEAIEFGVVAVCLSPSLLPFDEGALPNGIATACVVGFPSGAHHMEVKALEAGQAIENGATEIDMVVNLGLVYSAQWIELGQEIAAVRAVVPSGKILKVIIESAALSNEQIVMCCRVAVAHGADFVKTSTGFHKSGGASIEAVELMRSVVGQTVGVKASGGIRTRELALQMINAGANRIGTSATRAILFG